MGARIANCTKNCMPLFRHWGKFPTKTGGITRGSRSGFLSMTYIYTCTILILMHFRNVMAVPLAAGVMFVKVKRRFFSVSMTTLVTKAISWNFLRYKWLASTRLHIIIKFTSLSVPLGASYTTPKQGGEVWRK